ncbi:hypothetical protein SASPL_148796 [Salvia splendens]|uniref:Uncharacterized protein n=1 Tax=Salvia splendens TaxID=180675 RepID=A0A8X8Z4M2_SALSN|nr:UPF0481 protein At3g47200-like [Salvia splendens]KAG6391049.1 hypothetical protein SASPL_148796 [Salvia splendens]
MAATGKIQKVQPLLLQLETNKEDYFPVTVSFGPYHHGEPELAFVEAFKPKAVQLFISGAPERYEFYHTKVVNIIGDIRNCYEEASVASYSDDYLSEMMLRDASLMIIYMEISTLEQIDELMLDKLRAMRDELGMLITLAILSRDLLLLQNQIPLFVMELLMDLRYGAGKFDSLLNRYLCMAIYGEYREKIVCSKHVHLVEAIHMLVVSEPEKTSHGCCKCTLFSCFKVTQESNDAPNACYSCKLLCCPRVKKDLETGASQQTNPGLIHQLLNFCTCKNNRRAKEDNIKKFVHSFRSVTELKAKGIHFKPNSTQSLMDVSFESGFFYGSLQLPEWGVSKKTRVTFMNLIAYEFNPKSPASGQVAAYISFMKSLIEKPEDVKELREKKIFYNMLGSDEEVFNVYKDINTYGAENPMQFSKVRDKIQEHYNSRAKTWLAEILHTNFRSPWTATAFLAALAALGMSAGQLYFAVYPNS